MTTQRFLQANQRKFILFGFRTDQLGLLLLTLY